MDQTRRQVGFWRDVALTLAAFALALQVFIPAGVMVSSQDGHGVLVICTGHGALTVSTVDGKAPAPSKKTSSTPCAFAGHAPPFTPPLAAPLAAPADPEVNRSPLPFETPGRTPRFGIVPQAGGTGRHPARG